MFYLYDPRTNILTETSYDYLMELTGMTKGNIATYKVAKRKLRHINCYVTDKNITLAQRREWYEKEKYQDEMWLPIHGSEGKFLISNYGRFKRVYKNHDNFLLPFLRKKRGNLHIKVKFDGIYKVHKVSKLVAAHFLGNPKPNEVIHHKNSIITDDFVGNLEYISKEKLGKRTGFKAKSKPVVQIDLGTLEVLDEYRSAREAGRKNFISYQAVLDNCNHKTKVCCGEFLFMFLEEYEQIEIAND